MRRRVRIGLPPPPRTLLPAGLLHGLPNCASVQRFSAAVSEVLRLWLRVGARFPRLSTARLRLLETVSRRRKQRSVRKRRRPVRKLISGPAWIHQRTRARGLARRLPHMRQGTHTCERRVCGLNGTRAGSARRFSGELGNTALHCELWLVAGSIIIPPAAPPIPSCPPPITSIGAPNI
jgi:hypothetical protein